MSAPLPSCTYCGSQVDPRVKGVFRKIEGWVEQRDVGGTNSVSFKKELGEYACKICIETARKNIHHDQMGMF